ncbi:CGNR zinc finger domain-containing protein [Streptomyces phytohabitans]|uniref:CGNR zinc finger domain-containing protein n=1 Tax=Streptomyces phytohabitans TaxID=1150371 RepID=UPI00345B9E0C
MPPDARPARHSVLATARRTAALVNVLAAGPPDGDPDARLAAVAAVLREYGETEPLGLTPREVAGMRTGAALLREVFAAADADGAATVLNGLLAAHTVRVRLSSHGGRTPWHPHLDRDDDAPWDEWFLASSCMALTVLVWDHQRPPGGVCAAPGCDRVFLAQGSGPDRRYCSRRCATRVRVAAHRRARAAGPPGAT